MDFENLDWNFLFENTSPFLFKSKDGRPIKFYLCVHNTRIKKNLKTLIKISGGLPVKKSNITPFTVVLVDSINSDKIIGRVAFKISYIIDCIESRSLVDINAYICNKRNFVNKNYMDVIYFQLATFTDEESEDISRMITRKCNNPCEHCALGNERNSNNINSYSNKHCITCQCCFKQNNEHPSTSQIMETSKSDHYVSSSPLRDSSDTEFSPILQQPPRRQQQQSPDYSDTESSPIQQQPPLQHQQQNNGTQKIWTRHVSSDEDDIGPSNIKRPQSNHRKQLFTREEREAILKYIVRKNLYDCVGGTIIWKDMERRNVCPNRTWMSMQNHFKRNILRELYKFPFLTPDQIKKFKR